LPDNIIFDIYLVDDNSPDKTGEIVKDTYPRIILISGTGSLYWNQGMRLAWNIASQHYDYDFYLWINDDTIIEYDAFMILFRDYTMLLNKGIEAIIAGVCHKHVSFETTYGGRDNNYNFVIPNGRPQQCKFINGNFTLIPKNIFYKVGNLSRRYRHSAGDHDYGLRAIKHGFKCYVTSSFIAKCNRNEMPKWENQKMPFFRRLELLFSVKGGNFFDLATYFYIHFGLFKVSKYVLKSLLLIIFPQGNKKSKKV
jgi:GT2 family glycosyltransferase